MADYEDPYEAWKAGGRRGPQPGSQAQPQMPANAQPAAAPAPQPQAQQPYNIYSQQGPQEITQQNRQTADMTADQRAEWAARNINSFDAQSNQAGGGQGYSSEQAKAQWKAWDDKYDSNCPPNKPYRDRMGQCNENPDNCPEGTHVEGSDTNGTAKCVPNGGGAGGAGGGGGQGGGGGYGAGGGRGGSLYDNPLYKYSAEEAMAAAKDPNKAQDYFLGRGGADQYQQNIDAARRRVEAMPPGPARDAAQARLAEQQQVGELGIKSGAQNMARDRISGLLGQEGTYAGMDLQESQFGRSLAEQERAARAGEGISRMGLSLQEKLGMGNLALGGRGMDLDYSRFADQTGAGRDWQTSQAALDRTLQSQMQKDQIKANKPSTFDRVLGVVGALSDIRVKENIEPTHNASLSALAALPTYKYNYIWEETPRRGIMAQDLEKVAPELVHETEEGVKFVDAYGLLSLTMDAVKELDVKFSKLKKGRK